MKKFIYLLFIFVISICYINVNAETIYLKECEYTEEYINWLNLSKEERNKTVPPYMCKNYSSDKFALVGSSSNVLNNVSISDSKFDLRDYNLVTDVKDQGTTSSCWTFATNASIESNLLVNGFGTYDLSEAHMELSTQNTIKYNRLTFNRVINNGGNYYHSSAYLRNNWGTVLESSVPFSEFLTFYKSDYNSENAIDESRILNNKAIIDVNSITMFGDSNDSSCSEDTVKDIKEYLITNGALSSTMYMYGENSYKMYVYYDGSSYEDSEGNIVSSNQPQNHAVTIVGWDDTISKDKFTGTKPTRDGAFIIKNSYGTKIEAGELQKLKEIIYDNYKTEWNLNSVNDVTDEVAIEFFRSAYKLEEGQVVNENGSVMVYVGDAGYQYVSYDDIRICNTLAGFFDADAEVEDYIYGYDNLGVLNILAFNESVKEAYFATVFDKQSSKQEELVEINLYFNEVGQEYEIYFANGNTKSTSSSKLVATGVSKYIGYTTIDVEQSIITSEQYSIIVKIKDNELLSFGTTSKGIDTFIFGDMEYRENVQYVSSDGVNYADITKSNSDGGYHLLIKAYTNEMDEVIEDEPTDNEDENKPSQDEVVEILPGKTDTNNDHKIEVIPNEMNNNVNNNEDKVDSEDNIKNPETSDNSKYILLLLPITLGCVLTLRKKVNKMY